MKIKDATSYERHRKAFHSNSNAGSALNIHSDPELLYKCAFPECDFKSNSKTTLRSHRFRKHQDQNVATAQSSETSSPPSPEQNFSVAPFVISPVTQNYESNEAVVTQFLGVVADSSANDLLLKRFTHLNLTLNTKFHVPDSTLEHIMKSYFTLLKESSRITASKVTEQLGGCANELNVKKVIDQIFSEDPMFKLLGPEGPLRSYYCRKNEYAKQFNYVKPVKEPLGLNDFNVPCHYHRVPIKESLKMLFSDDSVYEQYLENRQRRSVLVSSDLTDITSGSAYTNNELFSNDSSAIQLIFFQDDIEMSKALGSAACGSYKIMHMGYTLANLHPWSRAKVDPLQIAMLCKEKDVSYFGLKRVLQPIIKELKDLETNGVEIRGETLKVAILVLLGDNLGTHMISGFMENFSTSHYFCRYCEESRAEWRARWPQDRQSGEASESESSDSDGSEPESEDLEDSEHEDGFTVDDDIPLNIVQRQITKPNLPMRTVESYKKCVELLDRNPNGVKGVVGNCELNQLKYFHVIGGTPSCWAHDCFEGFAPYDLQLCLNKLCATFKFSMQYINRKLKNFDFQGKDRLDRPPCKLDKKRKRIKGNAVQIWVFIRILPLLIGDKITDKENPVWVMVLTLVEVVRLVSSPVIARTSLSYMHEIIQKYLHLRTTLFPLVPLRAKHHFLEHEPTLAEMYGPAMRTSTLHFERKHKFFRGEFLTKKCYKNPTFSLSDSHQKLQSAISSSLLFENSPVVENPIHFSLIKTDVNVMKCLASSFGMEVASNLLYSFELVLHGTSYSKDAFIVSSTISQSKLICLHVQLLFTDGKVAYALGVYLSSTIFFNLFLVLVLF